MLSNTLAVSRHLLLVTTLVMAVCSAQFYGRQQPSDSFTGSRSSASGFQSGVGGRRLIQGGVGGGGSSSSEDLGSVSTEDSESGLDGIDGADAGGVGFPGRPNRRRVSGMSAEYKNDMIENIKRHILVTLNRSSIGPMNITDEKKREAEEHVRQLNLSSTLTPPSAARGDDDDDDDEEEDYKDEDDDERDHTYRTSRSSVPIEVRKTKQPSPRAPPLSRTSSRIHQHRPPASTPAPLSPTTVRSTKARTKPFSSTQPPESSSSSSSFSSTSSQRKHPRQPHKLRNRHRQPVETLISLGEKVVVNTSNLRAVQFKLTGLPDDTVDSHTSGAATALHTDRYNVVVTGATVMILVRAKRQPTDSNAEGEAERSRPRRPPAPTLRSGRIIERSRGDKTGLREPAAVGRSSNRQPLPTAQQQKKNKQKKKKTYPPQRIAIRVYSLNETDAAFNLVTEMSLIARKERWEKLLLPTTVVQAAMDSNDGVLRLLIACDRCETGAVSGGDEDAETGQGRGMTREYDSTAPMSAPVEDEKRQATNSSENAEKGQKTGTDAVVDDSYDAQMEMPQSDERESTTSSSLSSSPERLSPAKSKNKKNQKMTRSGIGNDDTIILESLTEKNKGTPFLIVHARRKLTREEGGVDSVAGRGDGVEAKGVRVRGGGRHGHRRRKQETTASATP